MKARSACRPRRKEAIIEATEEVFRYPDGSAKRLRAAIGKRWGLDPDADRLRRRVGRPAVPVRLAYGGPGREIIMSAHGFSIYHIAGAYAGSRVIKVPERNLTADLDAMLARGVAGDAAGVPGQSEQPDRLACCRADEVARFRAALPPDVLLVLDAAYAEYVTHPDYDRRRQAGGRDRQHGDDADLLEDLRPGRHADRLVLCAGRRWSTC